MLTIPDLKPAEVQNKLVIPVLDHGFVQYIAHMGDDLTPLEAARMSTGNPTGVDEKHDAATRDYLWRHQHSTPFEMSVLQVEMQMPIFVAREQMRHRTFSYNEYSQRYSEALDKYYLPEMTRVQGQSQTNKQGSDGALDEKVIFSFLNSVEDEQQTHREIYEGYLENGIARELARINMPVSNYTKMRAQANLRNWLHYLNLRMAPNAQYEIRVYAYAVAGIIKALWPQTWAVFEEHTLNGATFSQTERQILKQLLLELNDMVEGEEETLKGYLASKIGANQLSKAKVREFLAKILP